MSNWKQEGFEKWSIDSRKYARLRPHAPLQVPITHSARKLLIANTLGIVPGQTHVVFTDYAQRRITSSTQWLCVKLAKDEGHTAYVGWIAHTLRDPIEVWERYHDSRLKRHYFSAYHAGNNMNIVSYMTVALSSDNTIITAFQKNSANGIDNLRDGTLLLRCK